MFLLFTEFDTKELSEVERKNYFPFVWLSVVREQQACLVIQIALKVGSWLGVTMFQGLSTTFLEENSFVIVPRVHKAHENWTSVYWALVGTVGEYWTTVNLSLRLPLSYIWQSELLIKRLSIENSKFKDIVSFCITLFHFYFFFLNMSFFNFKGKLNKLKWLKDTLKCYTFLCSHSTPWF